MTKGLFDSYDNVPEEDNNDQDENEYSYLSEADIEELFKLLEEEDDDDNDDECE